MGHRIVQIHLTNLENTRYSQKKCPQKGPTKGTGRTKNTTSSQFTTCHRQFRTPTPQLRKFTKFNGCGFFAYSWKLPAYSGAFLLAVGNFGFFTYSWSFFAYSFSFFAYNWSFLAYSGKLRLTRALRDCKQRSLTVSKKAPTVSKKTSPKFNRGLDL